MAYESRVQARKSKVRNTTLGENIDEVLTNERKEQEFNQNMLQYIDSLISLGVQHGNLDKIKFMFIHVNWFFKREIGINKYEFFPAEFAVAEFSLRKGIENIYHEIIKSKIPLGWKSDAYRTSMESHKIAIELKEGEDNFALMYDKLVAILKSNMTGNKFPPLFTKRGYVVPVQSLLERMTNATRKSMDDFVVYSIESLFGSLRNAACLHVDNCTVPLVVAAFEFDKDIFSSVQNLECAYHKNIDGTSEYCSMAVVKQWSFTICDYCCEYLDIPMVEGVHCPVPSSNRFDKISIKNHTDTESNLSITDKHNMVSMTGVSKGYRRMYELTYDEQQQRRNECKPLKIIDHSKFHTLNYPTVLEKPLRPPKTISQAFTKMKEDSNLFITSNFPPIRGRGRIKKTYKRD